MSHITSSPMAIFRFEFHILLLVCCVVAITSYKIDHHLYDDRNERAVTEWRFRRNFLQLLPFFDANYANDDLVEKDMMDNDDEYEIKADDKKYLPNLSYDRIIE
ncbi:unnamed protein product [Rotaria sp. Silwood2]|nr:unnamed protein product [Rotaria sp. Silwood2]CAF2544312.1 unnamed protein product [Rotaria sp. Silwood2]CAF2795768.1 unnamed protein product [Rotaria sp. Silwood2]CAF2924808.1 unnamed protein product [Rotaria sp. Silwood2]CAF3850860.1 unnamed protein product [Rotaria sp. Silwood2]